MLSKGTFRIKNRTTTARAPLPSPPTTRVTRTTTRRADRSRKTTTRTTIASSPSPTTRVIRTLTRRVERTRPTTTRIPSCECGVSKVSTKEDDTWVREISGGKEAIPNEFPWMVRLINGCTRGKLILRNLSAVKT